MEKEIIKDENGIDTRIIRNEKGEIIAEVHGELNIDLIAMFFIKNMKRTPKGR